MEQPVEIQRTNWLALPVSRLLVIDRTVLLFGLILLLTVISRFWDLGARALHHDESLHAVYSHSLYARGEYRHEPLMHGPMLFHLTAFGYWLFGASDFTARLVPALLGIFLAWFPWKFRPWLGTAGALATSALMLISPTILYYSRFIREDIFAAAWIAVIVYGLWKYMDEGKDFHLYVMAAGWALLFSQKEISYLLAFVFWTFLAVLFALRYLGRLGPRVPARASREWHLLVLMGALFLPLATAVVLHLPTVINEALGTSLPILDPGAVGGNSETSVYNDASRWPLDFDLRAYSTLVILWLVGFAAAAKLWDWRKFLKVAAVFYAIFILFHTTFLTNLFGIGSGMIGALGYWIEQHGVRRGEQPWYYYILLLPLYEFLPLLLGLGGGALLLARRRNGQIVPESADPEAPLNARALWPYFNFWWFAGTFALLSIAGEKMPWLLVHIALPLIFLGGWALGKFLESIEWQRLREQGGLWFGLLFAIAVLASLTVAWLLLTGQFPFRGSDEVGLQVTARWLLSLLILGGAAWGAMGFSSPLGGRAASQVAILGLTTLLALATVRFALIASFINGDRANEPLIFVQSSPSVTMLMDDLEAISERIAGDKNIHVAYDSFSSWPFEWYLRDYPNRFFYGGDPQSYSEAVSNASVVLVGVENEQKLKPLVQGYVRHEYPMRWWFPEDYKDLTQVVSEVEDSSQPGQVIPTVQGTDESPLNVLRNIWRLAQKPQYREDFIDFVLNRRVTQPLGSSNFVVYIKPEVVAEVWGRQGAEVVRPTTLLAEAPYLDVTVPLLASATLTGEFLSPRNVAVLPDGTLAVADSGNHRVQLLSPDGEVIGGFGGFGTEAGQFNEPWGIAAAPDGTLYVADTWNHRIQHLDREGRVLDVWGTFADVGGTLGQPSAFYGPRDVAVDGEGNVYVTDTGNKRVQKFDAAGNFLAQVGGAGSAPGQLAEPVGIALAPDGTIWVADTWNQRVQVFSEDLSPLRQIAVESWAGQNVMNKPYIAVSETRLWLSDPEGYRIIEMDHEGNALRVWGKFGSDLAGLNLPVGLAFDGERLWVADSENQRILGYEIEAGEE